MNTVPYEVIATPFVLYRAPVGTPFPAIDEEPEAPWVKVGTNGDLNYEAEGVTVQHSQSTTDWRALGDSGTRKVFRTEEGLMVSLQLTDLTLEQYMNALNDNAVETELQGSTPTKKIGLSRGLGIATFALLVRGPAASPYMEDGNLQYEIPIVCQSGSPEPVFRRDQPATLALEYKALVDPSATDPSERFGRLRAEYVPAT